MMRVKRIAHANSQALRRVTRIMYFYTYSHRCDMIYTTGGIVACLGYVDDDLWKISLYIYIYTHSLRVAQRVLVLQPLQPLSRKCSSRSLHHKWRCRRVNDLFMNSSIRARRPMKSCDNNKHDAECILANELQMNELWHSFCHFCLDFFCSRTVADPRFPVGDELPFPPSVRPSLPTVPPSFPLFLHLIWIVFFYS